VTRYIMLSLEVLRTNLKQFGENYLINYRLHIILSTIRIRCVAKGIKGFRNRKVVRSRGTKHFFLKKVLWLILKFTLEIFSPPYSFVFLWLRAW